MLEALANLDVSLSNEGIVDIFRKDDRESITDITFCSLSLVEQTNWIVFGGYTHSGHQAIRLTVSHSSLPNNNTRATVEDEGLRQNLFVEALRVVSGPPGLNANELTDALVRACDVVMPRKLEPRNKRRPAYWWNEQLSNLRADCLKFRD